MLVPPIRLFMILALVAISGNCASSSLSQHPYASNNPIEIGMSQGQVRAKLGKPDEVSSRPATSVSVINGKRSESGARSKWTYVHHKNPQARAARNAGVAVLAVGTIGTVNPGPDVRDSTKFEVEFTDGKVSGWE